MRIAVVANGEIPIGYEAQVRNVLAGADLVIAADGGLAHCRTLGITPSILVGDLDSVDPQLIAEARLAGVDLREFPADKDATDLELALEIALASGVKHLLVVAPFGGRLDHELATIGLLASALLSRVHVEATDGRRHLWIVRRDQQLELPVSTTVSLIPLGGDVTGVTTTGLQWPLLNATLPFGSTRGVSNNVAKRAQSVSVASGVLAVIADEAAAALASPLERDPS